MRVLILLLAFYLFINCTTAIQAVTNKLDLFIQGALIDVNNQTIYNSSYHKGGYPPAGMGVCTDVVWRAFKNCNIYLKDSIDRDIKLHPNAYGLSMQTRDPNIDFRRVKNQKVYFSRYFKTLSTSIDTPSLKNWKPGQLVTFKNPDHVAILSTKTNAAGIPLLIHNQGPVAREADDLQLWIAHLTGRFASPWLSN